MGFRPCYQKPPTPTSPILDFDLQIVMLGIIDNSMGFHMTGRTISRSAQKEVARKTIPCWHFVNSEGECPHGAACDFVHDMELHKVLERDREQEKNATGLEKTSHCWAHVQGWCRKGDCSYLHPANIKPYIPYTPCVDWSYCQRAPYCPFQHPERLYYQGVLKGHGKYVQSIYKYFQVLVALRGKPMTFRGTTYFPTSNVTGASDGSGMYLKKNDKVDRLTNVSNAGLDVIVKNPVSPSKDQFSGPTDDNSVFLKGWISVSTKWDCAQRGCQRGSSFEV
ncbi:hypothetical protein AX15_000315 [Amanita polypyramis BW_CC]|nr:hypothetical protein AX15_000315 [Amanita polypyramis BW_CC]